MMRKLPRVRIWPKIGKHSEQATRDFIYGDRKVAVFKSLSVLFNQQSDAIYLR